MLKFSLIGPVFLCGLLLVVPACVELTGQRISWFYDAGRDVLSILIFYDGIHESKSGSRKGADQIPEFVENGDVLFLDWPFHFNMKKFREQLEDSDPVKKDLARLILSVETKVLGTYRDMGGRIGGAQLVIIREARRFVNRVNGLISRGLLKEKSVAGGGMERTLRCMCEAAGKDHQWIEIRGHSIRFCMPVHAAEWAGVKENYLQDLIRRLVQDQKKEKPIDCRQLLSMAASVPVSYIDEGDRVTFVVGREDRPVVWRLWIRDEYETSLEKVVVETVKMDLDREVAGSLLEEKAAASLLQSTVLSWGPPEAQVRVLLGVIRQADEERKKAARERLEAFGEMWNREVGMPEAPAGPVDVAKWESWYRRMRRSPSLAQRKKSG